MERIFSWRHKFFPFVVVPFSWESKQEVSKVFSVKWLKNLLSASFSLKTDLICNIFFFDSQVVFFFFFFEFHVPALILGKDKYIGTYTDTWLLNCFRRYKPFF